MPDRNIPRDPGSWIGIHLIIKLGATGGSAADPEAIVFDANLSDEGYLGVLEDSCKELVTYRRNPRSHRVYQMAVTRSSFDLKRYLVRLIHHAIDGYEARGRLLNTTRRTRNTTGGTQNTSSECGSRDSTSHQVNTPPVRAYRPIEPTVAVIERRSSDIEREFFGRIGS